MAASRITAALGGIVVRRWPAPDSEVGVVVGELGHHGGGGRHSDALVFHPAQRDVVTEHGERADCVGDKGDLVAIPTGMQLECPAVRRR